APSHPPAPFCTRGQGFVHSRTNGDARPGQEQEGEAAQDGSLPRRLGTVRCKHLTPPLADRRGLPSTGRTGKAPPDSSSTSIAASRLAGLLPTLPLPVFVPTTGPRTLLPALLTFSLRGLSSPNPPDLQSGYQPNPF